MIEFVKETLALLPFLFFTYLVLEAVEAHAGGAMEKGLERARSVGPLAGALAGAIPQCGVSAAAASFYAGGVVKTEHAISKLRRFVVLVIVFKRIDIKKYRVFCRLHRNKASAFLDAVPIFWAEIFNAQIVVYVEKVI